jgi:hypothetical protein
VSVERCEQRDRIFDELGDLVEQRFVAADAAAAGFCGGFGAFDDHRATLLDVGDHLALFELLEPVSGALHLEGFRGEEAVASARSSRSHAGVFDR